MTLQIVASLTDNTIGVIYDRDSFIIQATGHDNNRLLMESFKASTQSNGFPYAAKNNRKRQSKFVGIKEIVHRDIYGMANF